MHAYISLYFFLQLLQLIKSLLDCFFGGSELHIFMKKGVFCNSGFNAGVMFLCGDLVDVISKLFV